MFIDTTGFDAALIRTPVALIKRGDHIVIDLTGASPEHEGSFQALAPAVRAHCAVHLYQFPFHDFPISAGMLEPIDFEIEHGTVLDPDTEAAISCSPMTASVTFPLLGVTFSKMMFDSPQRDLVCGFASSNSAAPMISCTNQHGVKVTDFMGYPLNAWGLSARHDRDGVDVFGFPARPVGQGSRTWRTSRTSSRSCTSTRRSCPTRAGSVATAAAAGAAIGYAIHHVPYTVWTSTAKESKFPTHAGLFGGYSETVVPAIRVVDTDVFEVLAEGGEIPTNDIELLETTRSGGTVIREHQTRPARIVRRGELICSSTQGGGGYGDVLEREPERVLDDLRNGHRSPTGWRATSTALPTTRSCSWSTRPRPSGCARQERAGRLRRGKPGTSSTLSGTPPTVCLRAPPYAGSCARRRSGLASSTTMGSSGS